MSAPPFREEEAPFAWWGVFGAFALCFPLLIWLKLPPIAGIPIGVLLGFIGASVEGAVRERLRASAWWRSRRERKFADSLLKSGCKPVQFGALPDKRCDGGGRILLGGAAVQPSAKNSACEGGNDMGGDHQEFHPPREAGLARPANEKESMS